MRLRDRPCRRECRKLNCSQCGTCSDQCHDGGHHNALPLPPRSRLLSFRGRPCLPITLPLPLPFLCSAPRIIDFHSPMLLWRQPLPLVSEFRALARFVQHSLSRRSARVTLQLLARIHGPHETNRPLVVQIEASNILQLRQHTRVRNAASVSSIAECQSGGRRRSHSRYTSPNAVRPPSLAPSEPCNSPHSTFSD